MLILYKKELLILIIVSYNWCFMISVGSVYIDLLQNFAHETG